MIRRAIDAYERSKLKAMDKAKEEDGIMRIKNFLVHYGIDIDVVDSNPFEIDGIRFYAWDMGNNLGYMVNASRICPDCRERRTFEAVRFNKNVTAEMFGQWLVKPHLCEFKLTGLEDNKKVGFK
jgi:hypothetical protein